MLKEGVCTAVELNLFSANKNVQNALLFLKWNARLFLLKMQFSILPTKGKRASELRKYLDAPLTI